MKSVHRQLNQWRFRELVIRIVWGTARWVAVVGTVLAVACALDWAVDRYSGSRAWRGFLKDYRVTSWVLDPMDVGRTPYTARVPASLLQLALAVALVYFFLIRPVRRTPAVDDLAVRAERAFPEFDHRLVTALQLNRKTARTQGMSEALIAEVTREAGQLAERTNLLQLIDYRRLPLAAAVAAPVLLAWGAFASANAPLAEFLVKRQLMPWADIEIPRNTHLKNVTRPVWAAGEAVTVRYEVTGEFDPAELGTLRYVPVVRRPGPDGAMIEEEQPEEFKDLENEKNPDGSPSNVYSVTLPPASLDFKFFARVGAGRTKTPDEIRYEPPPQLDHSESGLTAYQILPAYLGTIPGTDQPFFRRYDTLRGDVVDALPQSTIVVVAGFNKPVSSAVLIPIERTTGLGERDLPELTPRALTDGRKTAEWRFPTSPKTIGYRIQLVDDLGFRNPLAIRRNIRMYDDRPPVVALKPESTRHPNPNDFEGQGSPKLYECDGLPVSPSGQIMVIYLARSDLGVRQANVRVRVVAKGIAPDAYPDWYAQIQHPRDDPNLQVFSRLPLSRFVPHPVRDAIGVFIPNIPVCGFLPFRDLPRLEFVPDLGIFTHSYLGMDKERRPERDRVNVPFYPFPSKHPTADPAELEGGGRYNFQIAGLEKKVPEVVNGKIVLVPKKIEIGDTVEVYVEVFDKVTTTGRDGKPVPDLDRIAGYSREAKRTTMVSDDEAGLARIQHLQAQQKLQDKLSQIAQDQVEVAKQAQGPGGKK